MLPYCGNNSSLWQPWVNGGLSPCLFFTISTSVCGGIIILFGGGQLYLFHKYTTHMEQRCLTRSPLSCLQIVVAISLALEPMLYLALQCTILNDKRVVGYEVFAAVVGTVSWLMASIIAYVECRWIISATHRRGHGIILLVFLAAAFVVENLTFISFNSSLWWFKERK